MKVGQHSLYSDETTGWITKESWFDFWQRHDIITFSIAPTPTPGLNRLPKGVRGSFTEGKMPEARR
jgi:hypothetical protein